MDDATITRIREELCSQIKPICRALYSQVPRGKASVMVGAGFSRFAEPLTENTPPFALWKDLLRILRSRMNCIEGSDDCPPCDDALALAEEYAQSLGRSDLDRVLKESLPDLQYSPGNLHKALLDLPWADVFTTNYDTLLERADIAYDVVLTEADIPEANSPRIVKLHGSFTSTRPFIITEEDYRTYPVRFAGFVNMIQQSLMENVFCLVGFSGDDPNFKEWIGWVRDRLGSSMPKIYLIGVLDLDASRRRYFESKNVIPVDLGPLFPRESGVDAGLRYKRAIEWLLYHLHCCKPVRNHSWPDPQPQRELPDFLRFDPTWPDLLSGICDGDSGTQSRESREPGAEEAPVNPVDQISDWRSERLSYPGWIVAPWPNLKKLRNKVARILKKEYDISSIDKHEQLQWWYEFVWRLDKALYPLTEDWIQSIELVLSELAPDREETDSETYSGISGKLPGESWVALSLRLMEEAGETFDDSKFNYYKEHLLRYKDANADLKSRYFAAVCAWFARNALFRELENTLDIWWDSTLKAKWKLVFAGYLVELSKYKQAEVLYKELLVEISEFLKKDSENEYLLSIEGWCIIALGKLNARKLQINGYKKYIKRLNSLGNFYNLNPYDFMESIRSDISKKINKKPKRTNSYSFDGVEKSEYSFSAGPDANYEYHDAFNIIHRNINYFVCLDRNTFNDEVFKATEEMLKLGEFTASLVTTIRLLPEMSLENYLDRFKVTIVSKKSINLSSKLLLQWAKNLMPFIEGIVIHLGNLPPRLQATFEAMSRLCQRMDKEIQSEYINLLLEYHRALRPSKKNSLELVFSKWWERILNAVRIEVLEDNLINMINLPYPSETRIGNWDPSENLLDRSYERSFNISDVHALNESISSLLNAAGEESGAVRYAALARLGVLYLFELLTETQATEFGEVLWLRCSEKAGLPQNSPFTYTALLSFPAPEGSEPTAKVKRLLLSGPPLLFTEEETRPGHKGISWSGSFRFEYPNQVIRCSNGLFTLPSERREIIEWNFEEVEVIVSSIWDWWNAHKPHLTRTTSFMGPSLNEQILAAAANLVPMLTHIVPQFISNMSEDSKQQVLSFLDELENQSTPEAAATPVRFLLDSSKTEAVFNMLEVGIQSKYERTSNLAIRNIHAIVWMYDNLSTGTKPRAQTLLDLWIAKISFSKFSGQKFPLNQLTVLLKQKPALFDQQRRAQLTRTLGIYLEQLNAINAISETEFADSTSLEVSVEEFFTILNAAARLASVLYLQCDKLQGDGQAILNKWKEIAESGDVPEISDGWFEMQ